MQRTFFGYITIVLLIPMLAVLTQLTYKEWQSAETVQDAIQTKIRRDKISLPLTSTITAGDGSVIMEAAEPQNRIYLQDQDIPKLLKQVFVAIEDQHFYEHSGIDISGISRAVLANAQADSPSQGGSTITQQLARNLYLTQEKTYNRKLSELLYAYELERRFTKQQILEMYINAIYFQNGAYGIEAAAKLYFNKPAARLSKAELVFLAGIPNNPSMYDPFTHYEGVKKRQERILQILTDKKILSAGESRNIKAAKIVLNPRHRVDLYPDYTSYVEAEFKELIAVSEGYAVNLEKAKVSEREAINQRLTNRVQELLESGIVIQTGLDRNIQESAVKSIRMHLRKTDIESAAVVIEHHTHELVSLIGGKYYKKYSFNRSFQSYRQPGSAIKPLLVYGPYLDTAKHSILEKVSAGPFCQNGYCPKNYGEAVYGLVTIEEAFAHSYNTPALRLFNQTGINKSFSYLQAFDFKKLPKEDYSLPAAIGGFTYGMSPLEITNAYTSFNNGSYQPARAIRSVKDRNGKVLYKWNDSSIKVWNAETVKSMRLLLNRTVTEGTGRKAYFPSSYIGGKTGTTNDYKDLWFAGLTEKYTAAIWVGKDIPASIESQKAGAPHLLIWKDIMKENKE
ncbi:transglycosylase domain-containing protein [Peribacillus deserti]|uniref:Penicillin-binding protein n=1 Tax=Peribacillus deserti TaxID=673318 RepID=A0A2N5M7I5_9BACI|nr:transglycosylase domain-containing protein [Peribacillus deserti]PLT30338.1 penicillin-binding protein [Peribacillus deserti]